MVDLAPPDGYGLAPSLAPPDGYSPADAQPDQSQIQGWGRLPAIAGSNIAKGALEGAGAIGSLEDLTHALFTRYVFDPAHRMLTGQQGPTAESQGLAPSWANPLTSSALVGYGQQAGLVNRPDLAPQTAGERYLAAGSEGAGSMLPYLPLAGMNPATAIRGLTQGAASGVGGEAGAEAFPATPNVARLGGSLLGLYAGGKAFDTANRVLGAATGASTPTIDAYRNLGIDRALAGDVTGDKTLQAIQAYAAKSPGGMNRVHEASERAVGQWGGALEDTASGYGKSATAQEAGGALQGESKRWLQNFKSASNQAWNAVDAAIPPNTPVPVPNYSSVINSITGSIPTAHETAKVLGNPLSTALSSALTKDQWNSMVRAAQSPSLAATPTLTWQDVKGIRSAIGERLSDPQLVADSTHAELKRIYGGLTNDLQSAAQAQGPAASAAFATANDVTRNGHGFVEDVLSKFLRGDQITPGQAASAALSGSRQGGTLLQAVRDQMPQAADELAAYKLREMGSAVPSAQNASGTRASPGTFVTQIAPRNLAPQARDALFASDPDLARRVQDLATVGDAMRRTERLVNTSNTASHIATGHALGGVLGAPLAAVEGYREGGVPGAFAGGLGALAFGFAPSYAAGRMATSPLLTGLLAAPAGVPAASSLFRIGATYPQAAGLLGYGQSR